AWDASPVRSSRALGGAANLSRRAGAREAEVSAGRPLQPAQQGFEVYNPPQTRPRRRGGAEAGPRRPGHGVPGRSQRGRRPPGEGPAQEVSLVLVIRAVSFKGQPLGREISARFAEAGGTIGRGNGSTLLLPDPERFISRTHAAISFQAGGFVITDSGTK